MANMTLLFFFTLTVLSIFSSSRTGLAEATNHGQELMKWLKATPGGYFHSSLDIRQSTMINNTTHHAPYLGIYATRNVEPGELLMVIPRQLIMHPGPPVLGERVVGYFVNNDDPEGDAVPWAGLITAVVQTLNGETLYTMVTDRDGEEVPNMKEDMISHEMHPINCATVKLLSSEMKKGSSSQWAPYVNYLSTHPEGLLPSSWTELGIQLLGEVLGHYREDFSGGDFSLPPGRVFGWIDDDWNGRCSGDDDAFDHQAYMLVMQRAWDDLLVPIADLLSHGNGRFLNTVSSSVSDKADIHVHSTRFIPAGEELFMSYNFCTDCANRADGYGTPEILRDYGFVEDYPRRFIFHEQEFGFDIDYPPFDSRSPPSGPLVVAWISNYAVPSEEDVKFLKHEVQRLNDFKSTDLVSRPPELPVNEWTVLLEYLEALIVAMDAAVKQARVDFGIHLNCDDGLEMCSVESDRYPTLEAKEEDWSIIPPVTCDLTKTIEYDLWERIVHKRNSFQALSVYVNAMLNDDVCMILGGRISECSSFRPQWHELFVHYPSKFVDRIERVLIVGGGTSMTLHEVLRYRSLAQVVVVERDQSVPRESYKAFGVQSHFDDPRVEWWFGDITTTLSLLFTASYDAFDVILVDLSHVEINSIQPRQLIEFLAQMLKLTGVMVQNELFEFGSSSDVFQETLHVHTYDVPVICSMSFIMSSNTVDFIRSPVYDHNIRALAPILNDKSVRHTIIRDYQKNVSNPFYCDGKNKFDEQNLPMFKLNNDKTPSPGILMVVDAYDTSAISLDHEAILKLVVEKLKSIGLTITSTISSAEDEQSSFFSVIAILREGYVTYRVWPSHDYRYAAMDIHLWSALDKQETIKNVLVGTVIKSFHSGSTSSFRIVACGMSNRVSSYVGRDSEQKRTKRLADVCGNYTSSTDYRRVLPLQPIPDSVIAMSIFESLEIIGKSELVVAVLCGQRTEECKSLQHVQTSELVHLVIPLYACPSIENGVEFAKDGPDRLFACEKEIIATLDLRDDAEKIRAIIVDASTTFPMAQVILRIFSSKLHCRKFLSDEIFVQATIVNRESWRKVFVDKFREEIFDDEPVFEAEVLFQSRQTMSNFEVAITSSGSKRFPLYLKDFVDRMEDRSSGLVSTITRLRSGAFIWKDLNSSAVFSHNDFDNSDASLQWSSQLSFGLQSIIQVDFGLNWRLLSSALLMKAFSTALRETGIQLTRIQTHPSGSGCVHTAVWKTGTGTLLWDGRSHVDFNLFTTTPSSFMDTMSESDNNDDDEILHDDETSNDKSKSSSLSLARSFLSYFVMNGGTPPSNLTSVQEFPRGMHRVMLYPKPDSFELPAWAAKVEVV